MALIAACSLFIYLSITHDNMQIYVCDFARYSNYLLIWKLHKSRDFPMGRTQLKCSVYTPQRFDCNIDPNKTFSWLTCLVCTMVRNVLKFISDCLFTSVFDGYRQACWYTNCKRNWFWKQKRLLILKLQ